MAADEPRLPGQDGRWRLAEIARQKNGRVVSVAVSGEVDISNVGQLREATMQLPNHALGLVVDLTEATFIDSATIGLLFELKQALARRSQGFRVVCPDGSAAERVLAMMSFDTQLRAEATAADAVAAIRRELSPQV
jgi:anti-anti-sigma factor